MRFLGICFLALILLWGGKAFAAGRPPLDENVPVNLKTATFALG
jgi:hypothetical protein